jgi:hypothetical protein
MPSSTARLSGSVTVRGTAIPNAVCSPLGSVVDGCRRGYASATDATANEAITISANTSRREPRNHGLRRCGPGSLGFVASAGTAAVPCSRSSSSHASTRCSPVSNVDGLGRTVTSAAATRALMPYISGSAGVPGRGPAGRACAGA